MSNTNTATEICIIQHSVTGEFHFATTNGILNLGPTLPGAVHRLVAIDIIPTHWLSKNNEFNVIPSSVFPK